MQFNSLTEQSNPVVLGSLPDPAISGEGCPRRTRLQLDFILLAIEALDLDGSQAMLSAAQELQLQSLVKNRVNLWRLRSTNPYRRYSQRRPLTLAEAKALVAIVCYLARRLTVEIRQLILAYEQLRAQQLSPEHHFYLANYLARFRAHFRSRMNLRRTGVMAYSSDERLNELALNLLAQ
ncbi:MAG TPA: DUF3038 domain-containing protein, partial [Candidatus Caenarcaniphilales bacterium]